MLQIPLGIIGPTCQSQHSKRRGEKKNGKITVPFPGKFGKRKMEQLKIIKTYHAHCDALVTMCVFALTIRDDTSVLWRRLIVTMVTRINAMSKKSGGTITLLHT